MLANGKCSRPPDIFNCTRKRPEKEVRQKESALSIRQPDGDQTEDENTKKSGQTRERQHSELKQIEGARLKRVPRDFAR
jgi:hypothetical protein